MKTNERSLRIRDLLRAVKRHKKVLVKKGGIGFNVPSNNKVCARGAVSCLYNVSYDYELPEEVRKKAEAMEQGYEGWRCRDEKLIGLSKRVFNRYKALGAKLSEHAQH